MVSQVTVVISQSLKFTFELNTKQTEKKKENEWNNYCRLLSNRNSMQYFRLQAYAYMMHNKMHPF